MIGASIKIKGEVSGDENLVVQGRVEGTIDLPEHEVLVGESGKVAAEIRARVVRIDGEVTGDVTGGEMVVIAKTGRVRGNIVTPRMTLEDGAIFRGSIDMEPGEGGLQAVSLATPSPAKSKDKSPELDLKSGKG